ncbi:hypothetical protein TNCV_4369901 [Trichonephila clavipes]|nr:hypothetical protein TNCV_4369901 [Trichonephila clavipes]
MNSSQHRCMNQAPASENQTQQRSLNSSLEATVGSPLVHLGGMLLNGSTSSLPNSPLQPSVTSITYGPWYTTFATSLILDGPILPCTCRVYLIHFKVIAATRSSEESGGASYKNECTYSKGPNVKFIFRTVARIIGMRSLRSHQVCFTPTNER